MRRGIVAAGVVLLCAGILGMTDIMTRIPGMPENVIPDYTWLLLLIAGCGVTGAGMVLSGKGKEKPAINPNEMKSCSHCGALIPAGSSRCEHCGVRFRSLYEELK